VENISFIGSTKKGANPTKEKIQKMFDNDLLLAKNLTL